MSSQANLHSLKLSALDRAVLNLPKIDLHRHLEGSLRLDTLVEVARQYQLDLPHTAEALRPLVQVVNNNGDYLDFLSKFHVLRHFYASPEIIQRFAYEAVADAAADNIKYLELRFTPKAVAASRGFPLAEATDWVIDAVQKASADFDLPVALIISLNRHEGLDLAEAMTRIAIDRRHRGVVALDLGGNEADFSADPFVPLFREAIQGGLKTIAHAGEWNGPENVRHAIEQLQVVRVGHGVRIVEDFNVVRLASERNICFEVCITSNLQSGVVRRAGDHPLRDMYHLQLRCTLNTDDPTLSGIVLTDEYQLALRALGLAFDDLKKMLLVAAESALLPDAERLQLRDQFRTLLDAISNPISDFPVA